MSDILFDFIDQTYCVHNINSDVRKEIREDLKIFNPKFVYAKPPSNNLTISNYRFPGVFGATVSHLKVLIDAKISGYKKSILVFEDDVYIRPDVDMNNILENSIPHLPDDWAVLYLNGNPLDKVHNVKDNLYKCYNMVGAFAYIFNCKYLDEYLLFYTDQIGRDHPECISDAILRNFSREYKNVPQYCVYPFIITHKAGKAIARNNVYRKYDTDWYIKQWQKQL